MSIYIVRYYDWDCESGETVNVCTSFTDVVAWLFDEYAGRFDPAMVQEPKWRDEEFSISTSRLMNMIMVNSLQWRGRR